MSESLVTNLSKSALLIILDSTGHSPSAHRAAQPQTAFPHSRYRSWLRIRRPRMPDSLIGSRSLPALGSVFVDPRSGLHDAASGRYGSRFRISAASELNDCTVFCKSTGIGSPPQFRFK